MFLKTFFDPFSFVFAALLASSFSFSVFTKIPPIDGDMDASIPCQRILIIFCEASFRTFHKTSVDEKK